MRAIKIRSAGLLVVGAMASVSLLTTACGDLAKRLSSKVAAVNLILDSRAPFAIGTGTPIETMGAVVNLVAINGPINQPTASPIAGANVTMAIGTAAAAAVTLHESASGNYEAVSGSAGAPTFVYASNQTYAITMNVPAGDHAGTYTTRIKLPRRTEVSGLPDSTASQFQPHGTPLTLTLTSGSYDYGMVVVVNSAGQVTYSNKPESPQDFVNFVLGNFSGSITIPGTAFPNAGKPYGIMVTGLASTPESNISPNLQILSHFLAGSAKTAIVVTN